MSTLTTHTTASRDTPSTGLCKFNTTSKAIEVSDGSNWLVYQNDGILLPTVADNYSLLLDGTDDYLTTSHHFSDIFDGSFSISMWIKTPSSFTGRGSDDLMANYAGTLVNGKGYMEFRTVEVSSTTAKLVMYFEESYTGNFLQVSDIQTGAVLNNSSWHNIVFTADRPVSGTATPKIYVDGVSQSLTSAGGTFPLAGGTWDQDLYLGGRGGGSPIPFLGNMDNIALFDKVLTANEVDTIYKSGGGGDLSQLDVQHWWKMEEGTGTTVADSGEASTTYTATFNSAPQWSSTVEPN